MKCVLPAFLALGFVALSAAPSPAQFAGARGGDPEAVPYGWLTSLEEGKSQARKTGKPVMVVLRCLP